MKRLFSLFLAILLAGSPLLGLSLRTDATENVTVSEIGLMEFPTLGEGDSTDLSWITVPEGEPYTLDPANCRWLFQSTPATNEAYPESTFGIGLYHLEMELYPAEGCVFADTVTVTAPGFARELTNIDGMLRFVMHNVVDTRILIPAVEVLGFPEAVANESYDCSTVVCNTEGVTAAAEVLDNDVWSTAGTFRQENFYRFSLDLTFPADQKISEETVVTVNGKALEDWTENYQFAHASWISPPVWVPSTVITEIQLLNLPEVTYGGSADLSGVRVPEDAPYSIDFSSPFTRVLKTEDGIGMNYYEETFDAGEFSYHLAIQPKDGYTFADTLTVVCEKDGFYTNIPSPGVRTVCSPIFEVAPIEIDEVSISFAEPVKGEAPVLVPQLPEDAPYTMEFFAWQDSSGMEMADTDVFESGVYDVVGTLQPKQGYVFSDSLTLKLNGEEYKGWEKRDAALFFLKSYGVDVTMIDTVEISFAELKVGETAPEITLKDAERYEKIFLEFFDCEAEDYMGADAAFVLGARYAIKAELQLKEGYAFGRNIDLIVNGEPCNCTLELSGNETVSAYYEFLMQRVIDTVEISFAEPKVGETMPEITLKNPELYEYQSISFYDYDRGDYLSAPEDVFRPGIEYDLTVDLLAAENCVFADEMTLIVNGKAYTDASDEVYIASSYLENAFYAVYYFDTFTVIDTVEISFAEPRVGASVPEITIQNPEWFLENLYTSWYCEAQNGLVEEFRVAGEYELFLDLYTADNYKFAEDVTFIVNGEVIDEDPSRYSINNYGFYYSFTLEDDRTVVTAVDFPEWPDFKVGDPIPAPVLPEESSEPFALISCVLVYDSEQVSPDNPDGFCPATGVFEDGKIYRMEYQAVANAGHRFDAETTKVTQNGKSETPQAMEVDCVLLQKYYNFSDLQLVDAVDLLLTEPVLGAAPGEVTVAEDAPYTVESYDWGITDDPDSAMIRQVTDYFPSGYPTLTVLLYAKEGALFTANPTVTVNGTPATVTMEFIDGSAVYVFRILFDKLDPLSVPALDFPAWPELKAGDSCEFLNELILAPTPEGLYAINVTMTDSEGNVLSPTDKLKNGETYALSFLATCLDDRYAFTDDTKVTQDGKEPTGYVPAETIGLPPMLQQRLILLMKYYNFNEALTVVDRIDIEIDPPEIGAEPGSITLPEDSPFGLEESEWATSPDGDLMNSEPKSGVWAEGEYPAFAIGITVPEGVLLAPYAEIYVNGELQEDAFVFDLLENETSVVVCMDQLVNDIHIPATGDPTNLAAYAVVLTAALCGLFLVIRKRNAA